MIKITNYSEDRRTFVEVREGEIFQYQNCWFMKTKLIHGNGHPDYNAIWLSGTSPGFHCGFMDGSVRVTIARMVELVIHS